MTATPIDDLETWIAAYQQAKHNAAQWAETAEQIKARITDALAAADAEVGTVNGKPAVKWSYVGSNRVDVKALKEDHPEIAAKYTIQQTSRRFTVVGD